MGDLIALEQAVDDAQRAAYEAGVEIRLLHDLPGQNLARGLIDETWPSDEGTQVTSNLMQALVHSGAYVSGAFIGDRIVGAAFAFPGRAGNGDVHLHSHMAAVLDGMRDRHIGTALKWHQRAWALSVGYETITWTFDPLVRRNAHLNLLKLGVYASEYFANFYGEMRDALNVGEASDRILARWELLSERTLKAVAAPKGLDPDSVPKGAAIALVCENDEPVMHLDALEADVIVAATPMDIIAIRLSDPALAGRWREAIRTVLAPSFTSGCEITGFTSDGSYLIERVWL